MKKFLIYLSVFGFLICGLSACSSDEDVVSPKSERVSTTFHVGMGQNTRARDLIDLEKYTAKLYLFEGEKQSDGTLSFSYKKELKLQEPTIIVEDLSKGSVYKVVFLAKETNQDSPALPDLTFEKPAYTDAKAGYIQGRQTDIDKDIFRSILTFTAGDKDSYETVLTRQNGALEIRIKNFKDVSSVTLHAKGYTEMMLNDGTGGQVIATGELVPLIARAPLEFSSSSSTGDEPEEIRVRLNLLPMDDITTHEAKDYYLEIISGSETFLFPLESDQERIPIFPNQVTWLTLEDERFIVDFSGKLEIDDDEWDSWHK